jgi:hypothetical protein
LRPGSDGRGAAGRRRVLRGTRAGPGRPEPAPGSQPDVFEANQPPKASRVNSTRTRPCRVLEELHRKREAGEL